jgi:hypothetical protein
MTTLHPFAETAPRGNKLDIEATSSAPFPADRVRAVKENAAPANLDIPHSDFS